MTEPTRGARARRGHRRPGSLLLTILLVLAITASSALVFTNSVELLKLAVIVALWAAVVAAFVSFIYRRQADLDHAKSRDLKLVYDLQLDREISARREYELSIESQLRRELASEMRAQTSDEVASLRAELAALRANLEMIFDTDLQSRPAIETERTAVHRFGDWNAGPQGATAPEHGERNVGPERVISSRIDTEAPQDTDPNTEESPIIDVPIEPQPPEGEWAPYVPGGAHRRPSEPEPAGAGWRPPLQEEPGPEGRRRAPEPGPEPAAVPIPEVGLPWMPVDAPPVANPPSPNPHQSEPPRPRREPARTGRPEPTGSEWQPVPAEGEYIPAGVAGSNWASQPVGNGLPAPAAEKGEQVSEQPSPPVSTTTPTMSAPPTETPRQGRHYTDVSAAEAARRARHSAAADVDAERRSPTLATPAEAAEVPPARHRGSDDEEESAGQHIGGQPVSELMARLQATSTGGGRRRRREE
ncbi:DUF6779 domain-containing protein [Mycolicibacterium hodleri]|uniref:DUF6779 domain-containing protein n=1 Tax=Mycolicibacterium hodleri TaxID=49897 RepID=A0A502E0R7_9MYCO|nr:DUF6779 domain-containing protein [Mycolicibacterium hodleri]TPG31187.1 hypothetical protein EAH80_24560 [Mycolicibacterium hodleri]